MAYTGPGPVLISQGPCRVRGDLGSLATGFGVVDTAH